MIKAIGKIIKYFTISVVVLVGLINWLGSILPNEEERIAAPPVFLER